MVLDTDTIDRFRRAPTDHRKYLAYMDFIKNAYGSILNFVQERRLKWTDLTPVGPPFSDSGTVSHSCWSLCRDANTDSQCRRPENYL